MAIDAAVVEFLLAAKNQGASMRRTALLGRQALGVSPSALTRLLQKHGIALSAQQCEDIYRRRDGYAEPLLEALGAEELQSIDASGFEGASIVHDLNNPVAPELKGQFDLVFDGGTLEHIFNFPVAMRNCMDLLQQGGHFLGISPANNYMGHGFYQFSPELYFRVLSPENGFEMRQFVVFEEGRAKWYAVADPAAVQSRVTLRSRRPVAVAVLATKVQQVNVFAAWPQQSDYVAKWSKFSETHEVRGPSIRFRSAWRRALRSVVKAVKPRWGQFYRSVDLAKK